MPQPILDYLMGFLPPFFSNSDIKTFINGHTDCKTIPAIPGKVVAPSNDMIDKTRFDVGSIYP